MSPQDHRLKLSLEFCRALPSCCLVQSHSRPLHHKASGNRAGVVLSDFHLESGFKWVWLLLLHISVSIMGGWMDGGWIIQEEGEWGRVFINGWPPPKQMERAMGGLTGCWATTASELLSLAAGAAPAVWPAVGSVLLQVSLLRTNPGLFIHCSQAIHSAINPLAVLISTVWL